MSHLDDVLPTPRKLELDGVDLAIPPERAWELVRHGDLGRSPLVRALFATRTATSREPHTAPILAIDGLRSTPEQPGFQVLVDDPPREVVVGAIGKVWRLAIPFVHVHDAGEYRDFARAGYVKVAWAVRVTARGTSGCRVEVEVRVDATDDASWRAFRRYFAIVGPFSHLIRRSVLSGLGREHGFAGSEEHRHLPGDTLLADATAQVTQGVVVRATPEEIWPWMVQMGCRRAGFYSIDALDNGGVRSAREIHPELQVLRIGDVIPAAPVGADGFEVIAIEAPHTLVLGGLYDVEAKRQLPFASARPRAFWHVTWAFELEPLEDGETHLHVRARAAFSSDGRLHGRVARWVHHFMEAAQLRHLAARVERRQRVDGLGDVAEGLGGAAIAAAALLTPFAAHARSHWGLDERAAAQRRPGDALIEAPRWSWTHGIDIDAPAADVWPWVVQIGADRGGFYSYQWLENLVGCRVRNADVVHPEWQTRTALRLHPDIPPLAIVDLAEGSHFVAYAGADASARANGGRWAEASWLFQVEPLGAGRSRFVSRFRCASSEDLVTRASVGPAWLEPIGFAMDRRMLLGVKDRAERRANEALAAPRPALMR